uniref:glutamate-1-semialdehyde 2,1-aminomutase n=1 Tax=uncultured prokaryote TaxID=198431 RepID=H5SPA1_9ZZZZ|nr:glutamate-1-semialdehyde-2,1-aminomutase [uncultured prokaryote]
MLIEKSVKLFDEAKSHIPGGVNSPVRAFGAVGGTPLFISSARGCRIYDVDGNSYIDYVLSWGPMILGHSHPRVVEVLRESVNNGTSYGAPTQWEVELARLIKDFFPSIEMVRLVCSGTEATMSAIRLARAFTRRDKIVKFEGCYHGHVDYLLVKAGSGATTFGTPDSPGVPHDFTRSTIVAPFNDSDFLKNLFMKEGKDIACVIVEPVCGNMGVVLPKEGFLHDLREITQRYDSLLIFDEVITGFRLSPGGAQELFNVRPDITCLGKILGGGLPIGAYGGKREIMQMVSPSGPVYQAGTLSGNPLATRAGIETLKVLRDLNPYRELDEKTAYLCENLLAIAKKYKTEVCVNRIGSMFTLFFTSGQVWDYRSALRSDRKKYSSFFHGMLKKGIYLAPSQFEAAFLSIAHTSRDIEDTIRAADEALRGL